jgi:Mn2+/Fe2+ NRAMP family transporter
MLLVVGPGIVWAAEYIGAGETTMAPRVGALFGVTFLWIIILGILLKYFIGLGAGHYTTITGEGMIDMFSRVPGPKNWLVWLIFGVQFCAAIMSPSAIAALAGSFGYGILPVSPYIWGWLITIFAVVLAWSGKYELMEKVMSVLVLIMIIAVIIGAIMVSPPLREYFTFSFPSIPTWARGMPDVSERTLMEVLPLLGWGAGGFASVVWYTYWVMGKGYGMTASFDYENPCPANLKELKNLHKEEAKKIKRWTKVVTTDATLALFIGILATSCFMIISAGTLYPSKIVPSGAEIGIEISKIFNILFGSWAGYLFLLAAICALFATQIAHFVGWPRMLSDCLRIGLKRKIDWKRGYKSFILIMLVLNMVVIYTFSFQPYFLAKIASIWDGLLLIPLGSAVLCYGLFRILPKMLSAEAKPILKPSYLLAIALIISTIVFSIFTIMLLPSII